MQSNLKINVLSVLVKQLSYTTIGREKDMEEPSRIWASGVYTGNGGFYHWLELPEGMESSELNRRLFKRARQYCVQLIVIWLAHILKIQVICLHIQDFSDFLVLFCLNRLIRILNFSRKFSKNIS